MTLTPESRPRLRHCTMIDAGGGRPLRLVVGRAHYDLQELAGDRAAFLRLKSGFDGRRDIDGIAAHAGLDPADVLETAALFESLGLLRSETPAEVIPAADFGRRLDDTLLMWRRQIGYHRLFQQLHAGRARREVLVGLFIETYHLVRLAPRHIAAALYAADDRLRPVLAAYLADERDHGHFLASTCANLGVDPDALAASHPTVGIVSLVQMLSEIGRDDTLAYVAGLRLFEAGQGDLAEGEASVAEIGRAYGVDPAAFAPALRHLQIDVTAGHASLLALALEGQGAVEAERAHRIVNHLHDLKHAFDQMHDGVLQYYEDISNYIPRPRVDYFSL